MNESTGAHQVDRYSALIEAALRRSPLNSAKFERETKELHALFLDHALYWSHSLEQSQLLSKVKSISFTLFSWGRNNRMSQRKRILGHGKPKQPWKELTLTVATGYTDSIGIPSKNVTLPSGFYILEEIWTSEILSQEAENHRPVSL